jgi:hypothetical protein
MKQAMLLMDQKILSAEQEAAFMKKIQAAGAIGQTAAALLRVFSNKKP